MSTIPYGIYISCFLFKLSSGKDVENHLSTIRDTLADTNNDWEKRVEAV
jgi:hypothetical protein